jgi:membrane protein YdbS with pleckstrin-like domain
MKKIIFVFVLGAVEQFGYTLYLIAVNRYMVVVSSLLAVSYMFVYLWIINYAVKDKNSVPLLVSYALAIGLGNYLAMAMHLIK